MLKKYILPLLLFIILSISTSALTMNTNPVTHSVLTGEFEISHQTEIPYTLEQSDVTVILSSQIIDGENITISRTEKLLCMVTNNLTHNVSELKEVIPDPVEVPIKDLGTKGIDEITSIDNKTYETITKLYTAPLSLPTRLHNKDTTPTLTERTFKTLEKIIYDEEKKINITEYTPEYKYCVQVNPQEVKYVKFGINCTIVIQKEIFYTEGLKYNMTNEVNSSHITIYDSNTLTAQKGFNITRRTDKSPYAVDDTNSLGSFDGDNDWINCGTDDSLDITEEITISAWIKSYDSPTTYEPIIASTRYFLMVRHTSNIVIFRLQNSTGSNIFDETASYTEEGVWHHVISTYNSSGHYNIYIDGISENSGSVTHQDIGSVSYTYIGKRADGEDFNGNIDNVKIWNRSLSSAEVTAFYTLGRKDTTYTDTSLQLNLLFDNTSESPVIDKSGKGNNGTFNGDASYSFDTKGAVLNMRFDINRSTTTYDDTSYNNDGTITNAKYTTSGKYGGAYTFDGDGDYITSPKLILSEFTISFWFNTSKFDGTWIIPIGVRGTTDNWFGFKNDGLYRVRFNDSTDADISGDIMQFNEFEFMTVTYNKSHVSFYKNATLISSIGNKLNKQFEFKQIGETYITYGANGSIDEVTIWNYALNASDVNKSYHRNLNKYHPQAEYKLKSMNISKGTNYIQGNLSGSNQHLGTSIQEYVNEWKLDNGYDDEGEEGQVLHLALDNNSLYGESNSKVYDYSGNGNNGTVTNAVPTERGYYDGGFEFDGNGDYIDCGNDSSMIPGTNDYSISVWLKTNDKSQHRRIVGFELGYLVWTPLYIQQTTGLLRMAINGAFYSPSGGTDITTGNWVQVVVSVDRDRNASFYVKGVLDGVADVSGKSTYSILLGDIFIGETDSTTFKGVLDEVRIYNRSLSADEINKSYHDDILKFNRTATIGLNEVHSINNESTQVQFVYLSNSNENNSYTTDLIFSTESVTYEYGLNYTQGLISYWSFDTNADDDYGTNDGNVRGSTTHVTSGCYLSGCYDFEDTGTGIINFADDVTLEQDPLTISMIACPRDAGETGKGVFMQKDGTSGYYIYSNANFSSAYIGAQFDAPNVPATNYNRCQYLVYTFGINGGRVYINGTAVGNFDGSVTNPTYSTGNMSIGNRFALDRGFRGTIDEVALYDRALDPGEIADLWVYYQAGYNPLTIPVTYYFSNSTGNDNNNGLSEEFPKKTLDALSSLNLNPSDNVSFMRGDTFLCEGARYCINLTSGTAGKRVTYQAYGNISLPNPIISGGVKRNTITDWVSKGGNLYESLHTYPNDIGLILLDDYYSIKRNESDQVDDDLEFWRNHTSQKILLYSTLSPTLLFSDIEVCQDSLLFYGYNDKNVNIYNQTMTCSGRGGVMAIGEAGESSDNITMQDCELYNLGGVFEDNSNSTRTGNCWGSPLNTSKIRLENNVIHDCYDACVSLQAWSTAGGCRMEDNMYVNNTIYGCYYNVEYFNSDTVGNSYTNNISFLYNTVVNSGGWSMNQRPDGNTSSLNFRMARTGENTSNFTISYNVIANGLFREIEVGMGAADRWDGDDIVMDYNFYNHTGTDEMIRWGDGVKYSTVSAFNTGTGNEANGTEDRPLFFDVGNNDFRPASNSAICTLSPSSSYVGALGCVDCSIPYDDYTLTVDTTLCTNDYNIADGNSNGVIHFGASDITLDGNYSTISGTNTEGSKYVNISSNDNNLIKNINFADYAGEVIINGDTEIRDCEINTSGNITIAADFNLSRTNITFMLTSSESSGINYNNAKYNSLINNSRLIANTSEYFFSIGTYSLSNNTYQNTYFYGLTTDNTLCGKPVCLFENNIINHTKYCYFNAFQNAGSTTVYDYKIINNTIYDSYIPIFVHRARSSAGYVKVEDNVFNLMTVTDEIKSLNAVSWFFPIYVTNTGNIIIRNNLMNINGSGYAIDILYEDSNNVSIINNTLNLDGYMNGIVFGNLQSNSTIEDNKISGRINRSGIAVQYSDNIIIRNNIINNSLPQADNSADCIAFTGNNTNITIYNNSVYGCNRAGIRSSHLRDVDNNIYDNHIEDARYGIYPDHNVYSYTAKNYFYNNTIINSKQYDFYGDSDGTKNDTWISYNKGAGTPTLEFWSNTTDWTNFTIDGTSIDVETAQGKSASYTFEFKGAYTITNFTNMGTASSLTDVKNISLDQTIKDITNNIYLFTSTGTSHNDYNLTLSSGQEVVVKEYDCVVPHDDLTISVDTTLCHGENQINDGGSAAIINFGASDITLDCNGSTIIGNNAGYGLRGVGRDNTVIKNCVVKNYSHCILSSACDNTKIINVTTINCSSEGIRNQNSENYEVINSTIIDCYEGIYLSAIDKFNLTNNEVSYGNRLIYVLNGGNNSIINNNLLINDYLSTVNNILYSGSDDYINVTIYNNSIFKGLRGIHIAGNSSYVNLYDNYINGTNYTGILVSNGTGVNIYQNVINRPGWNAVDMNGFNFNIYSNNLTNADHHGIDLSWTVSNSEECIKNGTVRNNIINNVTSGFHVINSVNVKFYNNSVSNSLNGIVLDGNKSNNYNNSFYENTFINSSDDCVYLYATNSTIYNNTFGGCANSTIEYGSWWKNRNQITRATFENNNYLDSVYMLQNVNSEHFIINLNENLTGGVYINAIDNRSVNFTYSGLKNFTLTNNSINITNLPTYNTVVNNTFLSRNVAEHNISKINANDKIWIFKYDENSPQISGLEKTITSPSHSYNSATKQFIMTYAGSGTARVTNLNTIKGTSDQYKTYENGHDLGLFVSNDYVLTLIGHWEFVKNDISTSYSSSNSGHVTTTTTSTTTTIIIEDNVTVSDFFDNLVDYVTEVVGTVLNDTNISTDFLQNITEKPKQAYIDVTEFIDADESGFTKWYLIAVLGGLFLVVVVLLFTNRKKTKAKEPSKLQIYIKIITSYIFILLLIMALLYLIYFLWNFVGGGSV